MDLNSLCIIFLSATILLVTYTQYDQIQSLRKLRDKVEDLSCRLIKRTEQQIAEAKELRKKEKSWRIHDLEETRGRCFDVGSALHASEICSFLTDVEKGILLSVIRCVDIGRDSDIRRVGTDRGGAAVDFNSYWLSNDRYFTGSSFSFVSFTDLEQAMKRLQTQEFWCIKPDGSEPFFSILDISSIPSVIRKRASGRWQLFVNRFQPNTYICDTMHPVFTSEAEEILMKPLLEAYRSGRVKHIDDFDLLRLSPSHQNEDKTKEK